MATTIITKNGSGAPADGDLNVGELAVDLTNKQLYTKNSGGVIKLGGSGNSGEWEVNGDDIYYDTGNVGVGTDNPQENLEITAGSSNAISAKIDGSLGKLSVGTRSNQSGFRYDIKHDRSVGSAIHSVGSNGSIDALTIDSTGNVGIGTDDPNANLSVQATSASTDGVIAIVGQNSVSPSCISMIKSTESGAGNGSADMTFHTRAPSGSFDRPPERMRIDSSGNVGLGTSELTDSYKMIVQGADQETANITDSGDHGATLFLRATGQEVGSGGAIAFGTTFGSKRPFAAIKSIVNNGSGNSTGHLAFSTRALHTDTALTERMRITQSGNVGIGTPTPADELHVYGDDSNVVNVKVENEDATGTYKYIAMGYGGSGGGIPGIWQNSGYIEAPNNLVLGSFGNPIKFYTNSSRLENMRLDSSGNLLVGATSGGLGKIRGFGGSAQAAYFDGDGTTEIMNINKTGTAGNYTSIRFLNNNFATVVGSITHTTSTTSYNTSSDKRLKENIVDAPAGNIDAIRVRSFDWKADGSHQTYGMVAQELVDVAPEAVTQGQTEDDMWGVDYSKLVPMMIKEIQDLKAEVAALKGA